MNIKEILVAIIACLCLLFFVVSCTAWRWNECRKVGHGVLYCVVDAGR